LKVENITITLSISLLGRNTISPVIPHRLSLTESLNFAIDINFYTFEIFIGNRATSTYIPQSRTRVSTTVANKGVQVTLTLFEHYLKI